MTPEQCAVVIRIVIRKMTMQVVHLIIFWNVSFMIEWPAVALPPSSCGPQSSPWGFLMFRDRWFPYTTRCIWWHFLCFIEIYILFCYSVGADFSFEASLLMCSFHFSSGCESVKVLFCHLVILYILDSQLARLGVNKIILKHWRCAWGILFCFNWRPKSMAVSDGAGKGPYQLFLCAVIMVIVGNLRCSHFML